MVAGRHALFRVGSIDQIVDSPFYIVGHTEGQKDQEAEDCDLGSYCGGHYSKNPARRGVNVKSFTSTAALVGHIGQHISLECGSGCPGMTRLRQW
jgi:hypothetical protein